MLPLVMVEGSDAAFRQVVSGLEAEGWRIEPGFGPPSTGTRVLRAVVVASAADAREALLAALAGQGLVIHAVADGSVIDPLTDDLRRLGSIERRAGSDVEPATIDPQGRKLLGLLAEGLSLGEAAALMGLSRRTADRRLASARRLLGTTRTTEAIARAARLGWLPPDAGRQR